MSVEIWPPLPPEQLKIAEATTKKRELDWLLAELHGTLKDLKHGLEDCYALLAPIDPGSTLVLSTPRNEIVKGHVTRVGTRIVKGTIHLRLRTLPAQTLTLNTTHPIHLAPLTTLHTLLTQSIDLLALTMLYAYDPDPTQSTRNPNPSSRVAAIPPSSSPTFIAAQLRLLAQSLAEASALLKGPPLTESDPSWTFRSAAPSHFTPPLVSMQLHSTTASSASPLSTLTSLATGGNGKTDTGGTPPAADVSPPALSFHLGIQDSSLVLWLRSLEPADAPVNFGTKLALAIGTTRRLEHDEADRVFGFCCGGSADDTPPSHAPHASGTTDAAYFDSAGASIASGAEEASDQAGGKGPSPYGAGGSTRDHGPRSMGGRREIEVFVREKVRVESADPSLLSLSAKLNALGHTLALARRNLAAVMGEELED